MRTSALLFCIAVLSGATNTFAQGNRAEEEVRQTIVALTAAYKDDLPKYFSYYDPNTVMLWSMRGRVTVKEYQEMTKTRKNYESTGADDLRIQIGPSGDAAVASYVLTTKMAGEEPELWQLSPTLFRRDGKWQIVYLHVSQPTRRPASR
jgi:hypothetical protein